MRRFFTLISLMVATLLVGVPAAQACGFLVSANGAVNLGKTTTLVVWEDGIERYITSFEFSGDAESFGSIIPLPAEPTDVSRAGDWTLQRLQIEVTPPVGRNVQFLAAVADSAGEAQVILRTQIDSLDIAVLKGGGEEVLAWVNENGFDLPDGPETQHMFDFYGDRTDVWLASRFDAEAAAADGFISGDGIPVQITMPVDRPWVPLHILHGASPDTDIIEADVFLITPDRPDLLYGEGLTIERSEPASDLLLDDLRSDENMEWIPEEGWFTYLNLETEAANVVYDLAIGVEGNSPSFVDAGFTKFEPTHDHLHAMGLEIDHGPWWNVASMLVVGLGAGFLGATMAANRRRETA